MRIRRHEPQVPFEEVCFGMAKHALNLVAIALHFPSILHLRNLTNVEKTVISCLFEVDC
jgi:hypothetical protein